MDTKKLAVMGMADVRIRNISKVVAFAGSVITAVGIGGMMMSQKCFTEEEMNYLVEHLKKK